MRAHHLWIRLIGIIWGLCLGPVAAADAPAATLPVCQRTARVRDALVQATCPRCACGDITPERLAALRELNLRQLGLTRLKAGDFAGLSALEKLDLTGNPLKSLPDSLPAELRALQHLKMELSLFTRLLDAVVTPLLDRPGFSWELFHQNRDCGPYTEPVPKKEPHLPDEELQSILQLPALFGQVRLREWRQGIYLAGVATDTGALEIAGIRQGPDQRLTLLAKAEKPIPLSEGVSYAFDLAPYRLSSSEVGFGVRRIKNETMASRLLVDEEELQVFRFHAGSIERVLQTVVYTRQERLGPPKGGPEEVDDDEKWSWSEESCSVIAVARSKTRGVFNWVKVQSSNTTRQLAPDEKPPAQFPAVVFRWTGEHFEAQGDPTTSLLFNPQ